MNKKRLSYLEFNAQKLKTEVTFSENKTFGSASLGDLFLIDYSSLGKIKMTMLAFAVCIEMILCTSLTSLALRLSLM